MKTEDPFHWLIYIYSRICKRRYYSFIRRRRFESIVFVLSARSDSQYYSYSFFFYITAWPLENLFLFCQPSPACWKTFFSFARPVRKITSHLPARRENHPSFAGPARWKNHLSSADPAKPGPLQTSISR